MKKLLIIPFLFSIAFITRGMEHNSHFSHTQKTSHSMSHHSHNTAFEKNKKIQFERKLLLPSKL